MSDPNWGFASGFLSGQKEQQGLALGQQNITLNQQAIDLGPVTLEKEKLALDVQKQSVQAHAKMIQMLDKAGAATASKSPLTDAASTMMQVGSIQMQSGLTEEGAKTMGQASQMLDRQSSMAYRSFEIADKQAKFVEGLVGTVETAQPGPEQSKAYAQAVATAQMLYGDSVKLPPYDPKTTPLLIEQMHAAADKHRSKAQEDLTRAQIADEKSKTQTREFQRQKMQADTQLAETRKALLEKNGGTGSKGAVAGIPKPGNVTAVVDALKTKWPNQFGGDRSGYANMARPLALEVEQEMKDTPGLTQPQAITRVVDRNYKTGHIALKSPTERPGRSETKPLPLPMTKDGKVDLGSMQAGNWYIRDGKSGVYVPGQGLVKPKDPATEDAMKGQTAPDEDLQ